MILNRAALPQSATALPSTRIPWQTGLSSFGLWNFGTSTVMSTTITRPSPSLIDYPDDDGQPMAENTLQFKWIVLIKEGLETLFHHDPNVFVAGDLLWYPVEGAAENPPGT